MRKWLARNLPLALVSAVLFVGPLASPATAQDDEDERYREPDIRYREFRKPYIEWLAGTVLIVACLVVSAKNPHRSHLD
jgi:hypothetical protein